MFLPIWIAGIDTSLMIEHGAQIQIVLALLAAACLILFLHPYVIYPLSLLLFPVKRIRRDPTAKRPSATLVFAAYNEERALPEKLENLREIKARYPDIQILSYSDCSSDRTLEMLQAEPELLTVITAATRVGKATGMRRMVQMATGDIVIFTDANVILDPDSIEPLFDYFQDEQIGGVSGTLRYVNENASPTAKVGGLYWRLELWLKRMESRSGSVMGADGSIFATRRELYPTVPPHLLDDMIVSMSVTFPGKRLVHADDVVAYEKNATSSTDEFRRKRRIACRAFNTHRFLWPQIRRTYSAGGVYKYISHKLLRWFGIIPLSIAAVSIGFILLHRGELLLFGAYVLLIGICYLLARAGTPLLSGIYEVILAIVATFFGVLDSFAGKTYQTWTPAVSRD